MKSIDLGWHNRMTVIPRGVIADGLPGLAPGSATLIVMPYDALARVGLRPFANVLLVQGPGGLDPGRLRAAVGGPEVLVTTVGEAQKEIAATPLGSTIRASFLIVTLALGAYAILAVIIALVVGADDRARALSYLRTLGLSEGQARGLTVLEIAPLIVLTAAAGLALGLSLPAALGPGIDLSAYAGSLPVGDHPVGLTTPVLLAAGLTAAAVLGALAHAAADRRRALGSVLRVGETP
jgi:putative ABC transport system permease protein